LPRRPGGGWMIRDVEMNDSTSFMQKNDEAVKVTECRGGDSKEIDAKMRPSTRSRIMAITLNITTDMDNKIWRRF